MRSLAKALRPLFALGLLGVACAAQSGAAQAQGGLNDFFSQLFAPPPQPSYVQPLVVPRGGPLARPQRGYVPRSRSADRVSPVRLPRAVPFRVRHASLPAPKDQTSLPRRGEGKAESPKPIKIVPREAGSDPAGQILHDATLRRGDIVVLPGGAKVFKGGRAAPYRLSDFEAVRSSKLLEDKTRRALMAMPLQPAPKPAQAEAAAAKDQPAGKAQSSDEERVAVTGSVPRRVGP